SGEQSLAPAAGRFAKCNQRVELAPLDLFALLRRPALIDLPLAQKNIGVAKKDLRLRRQSIPAGAANLLIIGLDALRQVGMANEADIGLVDPRAECNRGDDDNPVMAQKFVFMRRPDR